MKTKIGRKLCTLCIILLFLGLATISFVGGTNPIINNFDEKEHWAVIVCGGAEDNPPKGIAGAELIRNSSIQVYKTYKNLGYNDDHIYYLHDRNVSAEGADNIVSKAAVAYAITDWLKNHSNANDDCCIILNCHGSPRSIQNNLRSYVVVWNDTSKQYEKIFDDELDAWLDTVTCNVCTVVIDSCYSGSFIKTLSKSNRVIITGSSPFTPSIVFEEGEGFSYFFFNKLEEENVSYGEAWEYADEQLTRMKISEPPLSNERFFFRIFVKCGILLQNPQIDDNGDGKGHGNIFANKLPIRGDGYLALKTYPS